MAFSLTSIMSASALVAGFDGIRCEPDANALWLIGSRSHGKCSC